MPRQNTSIEGYEFGCLEQLPRVSLWMLPLYSVFLLV